jgi:teichuronic acid biosynthesis glycosyltransferase TuaG
MELVSIITPSYNASRFIGQTIESIQAQTYTNWELLITDDYSSDNTIEIVLSYVKNDSRINLFNLTKK